jgi:UDP:flavonoid glycosyltransferase YjiC (YdhE family)
LGHLLPLLPLAFAAREAGDEVAIASGRDRQAYVETTGHRFFAAGLSTDDVVPRMRAVARELTEAGHVLDSRWGFDLEHTYAEVFTTVHAPAMVEDLLQIIDLFGPDVIVCDGCEFGAPVAAAVTGIPCASHGLGLPFPETLTREAGRWAAPMWTSRRLDPPEDAGMYSTLHFSICPPSLDPGDGWAEAPTWPIGPPRHQPSPPDWLEELPARPTVYLTLGTARGRERSLAGLVVESLADTDVNVVVTVGPDGDPASLASLAQNVSAHRYVPQQDLLPSCSVVICHGGSGTVFGALANGVPLVVLPHMADQYRNAEAVEKTGCGMALRDDDRTPANIGAAVHAVLSFPQSTAAAAALKEEMSAMPRPGDAVACLHRLVGKGNEPLSSTT